MAGWPRGIRATLPVEVETNVSDWQALGRRIGLKLRDADEPFVLLVLADTRHDRAAILGMQHDVAVRYPVSARRALAASARGEHRGASAVALI